LIKRYLQENKKKKHSWYKNITTKRKVAWYGDSEYLYTYSNSTKRALAWTKELFELKQIVEKYAGTNIHELS
jgi:hypothetical protein